MNIPIYLLHSFSVFADSENLVDAAKKLQITQPALSKQLKLLESHLAYPAFTYSGRNKVLTAYGIKLHKSLKAHFDSLGRAVANVDNLHSKSENARIKIAARREILGRIAPKMGFHGQLIFVDSVSENIARDLLNRKIDIGITQSPPTSHELISKYAFRDQFVLLIPKSLMARRPSLSKDTLQKLEHLPFLAYNLEAAALRRLYGYFDLKTDVPISRAYSNWTGLLSMANDGLGWTLVPSSFLSSSDSEDSWQIEIPSDILSHVEFFVVYLKEFNTVKWFKQLVSELSFYLKG